MRRTGFWATRCLPSSPILRHWPAVTIAMRSNLPASRASLCGQSKRRNWSAKLTLRMMPTAASTARTSSSRCSKQERSQLGFAAVAYGLNVDDRKDFRPGQRAAAAHHIAAPLAEAGLTKADVRALAKQAGLEVWDKPASACLSSRIEYGRRVTPEALRMVEEAEDALRLLGFRNFRVRHHGAVARIEIAEDELPLALDAARLRRMSAAVRAAGFNYVAVDCDGYRSGSMNEILPVEVLTRAAKD